MANDANGKKFKVITGGKDVVADEKHDHKSFFSISHRLVVIDEKLPYDLFINSSGLEGREKYVRIFPKGGVLAAGEPDQFQKKYHQLYLPETQRADYLKNVCRLKNRPEAEKAGVLKDSAISYLGTLFDQRREFSIETFNQGIAGCREVVEGLVDVLQGYNLDSLQDLIGNLSFHDFYTYDHSINVSMYCIIIYRALNPGATKEQVLNAGFGGLLHDLGKIKIPTEIINKAGKLTAEEFAEIQKHPGLGFEILASSGILVPKGIDIGLLKNVVYQHHENVDGTGYPRKLKSDEIDVYAKITAVADFFDAITTKRSYHEALTVDEALALMKKSVGKKLDSPIFDLFTEQTKIFQPDKISPLELPIHFDPCQPPEPGRFAHAHSHGVQGKAAPTSSDFGKIIVKAPARKRSSG